MGGGATLRHGRPPRPPRTWNSPPAEVDAAWQVAVATRMAGTDAGPGGRRATSSPRAAPSEILAVWDAALEAMLAAEDLDGMATALYTVGGPVRMEGLFDAYAAAARHRAGGRKLQRCRRARPEQAARALSQRSLETLADLGVVELGTEEDEPAG